MVGLAPLQQVGEEGEVAIDLSQGKPWGLFNGYYRDAERTASVWHDGYYYTGDIAWMDEDGYFWAAGAAESAIAAGYTVVLVSRFFEVLRDLPV